MKIRKHMLATCFRNKCFINNYECQTSMCSLKLSSRRVLVSDLSGIFRYAKSWMKVSSWNSTISSHSALSSHLKISSRTSLPNCENWEQILFAGEYKTMVENCFGHANWIKMWAVLLTRLGVWAGSKTWLSCFECACPMANAAWTLFVSLPGGSWEAAAV